MLFPVLLLAQALAARTADRDAADAVWAAGSVALPRFAMEPSHSEDAGGGVLHVLVIADDSRADEPDAELVTGSRADSLSLWVFGPAGVTVIVLPRDVRVTVPGAGDEKLSGTLDYGPAVTAEAVTELAGMPVDHVIDVRFEAFRQAVDDVGGIVLDVTESIRDTSVGLLLAAGRRNLDGTTALQYARSRTPEVLRQDEWVSAGSGDLARLTRQRQVVAALIAAMQRQPVSFLARSAGAVLASGGVRADPGLDGATMRRITVALAGTSPIAFCTIPTSWEVDDAAAVSPFGPPHNGSRNFRVLAPGARELFAWAAAGAGALPAASCGSAAESG
jgi:LCP family protein required for cell wall assembly